MSEESKSNSVIQELTPEQQILLHSALSRIESDIFYRVLRRITYLIGGFVVIMTVGGLISWSSCSTNVENAVIQKLAGDPELRDKITTKSQATAMIAANQSLNVEKETAKVIDSLNEDLKQLKDMLNRASEESQKAANKTKEKK